MARITVNAPAVTPRPYGLFSVATPGTPAEGAWEALGVSWQPPITAPARVYDPEANKVAVPNRAFVEEDPSTIYLLRQFNLADAANAEAVANEFTPREERLIEGDLWAALAVADSTPEAAAPIISVIAALENYLATTIFGLGVIHLSVIDATLAAEKGLIKAAGSVMRTALGTPVIVGSGYDSSDAVAYASAPVGVLRSETFAEESRKLGTNDRFELIERTYLIQLDPTTVMAAAISRGGVTP